MITKPTKTSIKILVGAALFAALIITGCGSGDEKTETTESAATTATVPSTDTIPTPATDDTSSQATQKPVGTPN